MHEELLRPIVSNDAPSLAAILHEPFLFADFESAFVSTRSFRWKAHTPKNMCHPVLPTTYLPRELVLS